MERLPVLPTLPTLFFPAVMVGSPEAFIEAVHKDAEAAPEIQDDFDISVSYTGSHLAIATG